MATFMIMPWVVRRNVFFGVSVPSSAFHDTDLRSLRRTYLKWGILLGVITTAIFVVMYFTQDAEDVIFGLTYMTFGLILAVGVLYVIMWKKAKALKASKHWDKAATETVIADTSFYRGKIAVSPLWLLLYPIIICITLAVGFMLYDQIPMKVAMQYDFDGHVTRYAEKSYNLIFFAPVVQAFLALVMSLVYWMLRRTRPELDPNHAGKSVKQNTVFRYRWSLFIVFGGVIMMLMFLITQLSYASLLPTWAVTWIPMIAPALLIVAVIVLTITTGQSGSRVKVTVNEDGTKKTFNRNDDAYWRLGSFYVNPNDPAIFVEKRFGVGFTMNWAKPMSWIIIIGFLGITLAIVLLTGKLSG